MNIQCIFTCTCMPIVKLFFFGGGVHVGIIYVERFIHLGWMDLFALEQPTLCKVANILGICEQKGN